MEFGVSPEARAVLDAAAISSLHRGLSNVGVESILDALVSHPELLPARFQKRHVGELRTALERLRQTDAGDANTPADPKEVYYTARALELVREAGMLARRARRGRTAPGHLLLAILKRETADVSRLLECAGIDRGALASDLCHDLLPVTPGQTPRRKGAELIEDTPEFSVENFTTDLTLAAARGRLSRPYGRDRETSALVQALLRDEKHHIILVGRAGVGKTTIVEGLAIDCAGAKLHEALGPRRVIELDLAGFMAAAPSSDALRSGMNSLLDRVERGDPAILFLDDIHLLRTLGSTSEHGAGLAEVLDAALKRGRLRCVGATTPDEFREFVSRNPALERSVHVIPIDPMPPEETRKLLGRLSAGLARHHGVCIGSGTLSACVVLAERYLRRREFPEKAIDLLEQACARSRLGQVLTQLNRTSVNAVSAPRTAAKVTPHGVKQALSAVASLSLDEIYAEERATLANLESDLNRRLLGQTAAAARIAERIGRHAAGRAGPNRPDTVFFLLGPSGSGKTQLAKELARAVFGSTDLLHSFDLSAYTEPEAVFRLLGAPSGHGGGDDEGLLRASLLETPYCVLLFDRIEKAHPQIYDAIQFILSEGRLRGATGRVISFRHALILFATTAGAEVLERSDSGENNDARIRQALAERFRAEFLNGMDAFIPFFALRPDDARAILRLMIHEVRPRLGEQHIGLRMYESAYQFLARKGFSPETGAHELEGTVERYLVGPLRELVLQNRFAAGDTIDVRLDGEHLAYEHGARSEPATKSRT